MAVTNQGIAAILDETARLLDLRQANPFRARSYRRAAGVVRGLDEPVADIYRRRGEPGLRQLETVGPRLASALGEIVETGRLGLRNRLEGELSPENLFCRVPGIGEELAERIHDELDVASLEELEQAAHDGRLSRVDGIGGKRLQGIRDALAGMLSRSTARRARRRAEGRQPPSEPPVEVILELDREYRQKAERGELRRIAPKRFNPSGEAWLPVMEREHGSWDITLLFSNTKRAHELGKTRDWVVAYFGTDHDQGQCTIVTAGSGDMKGRRVVRGRERECREYYRQSGE